MYFRMFRATAAIGAVSASTATILKFRTLYFINLLGLNFTFCAVVS